MEAFEALRVASEQAGIPDYKIGPAMGKPTSYVSNGRTRGSSPRCNTMAAMLGVCGYSLAAIPHADVPDTALVIDPPDENTKESMA